MTETLDLAAYGPEVQADRPREKLLAAGPSAMETAELLAVLLGTGTAGRSVETFARELLERAGGLRPLAAHPALALASMPGLGDARAARILASLELGRRLAAEPLPRGAIVRDASDVFRHCHSWMRELRFEQFRAFFLDGRRRVIREELISQGTLNSAPVHPREVFAPAIRHSAAEVVVYHNHPSGDPQPSRDDLEITTRLVEAGELVGVRVFDHVIVGDGAFVSLAERGLMRR